MNVLSGLSCPAHSTLLLYQPQCAFPLCQALATNLLLHSYNYAAFSCPVTNSPLLFPFELFLLIPAESAFAWNSFFCCSFCCSFFCSSSRQYSSLLAFCFVLFCFVLFVCFCSWKANHFFFFF